MVGVGQAVLADSTTCPGRRVDVGDEGYHWLDVAGNLHRDGDLPAVVDKRYGYKAWYCHGILWRANGQHQVELNGGGKCWFDDDPGRSVAARFNADGSVQPAVFGRSHRVHWPDGTTIWYDEHHVAHRDGGLPAYVNNDGEEMWFTHGVMNRIDVHGIGMLWCQDSVAEDEHRGGDDSDSSADSDSDSDSDVDVAAKDNLNIKSSPVQLHLPMICTVLLAAVAYCCCGVSW